MIIGFLRLERLNKRSISIIKLIGLFYVYFYIKIECFLKKNIGYIILFIAIFE